MATSPYGAYLAHLRRGELAYQWSAAAGKAVFFPRAVSPYDETEMLAWRVSRGLGTVYSTTVVHDKAGADNVALVDCDEGFRLMTRVEGCQPEQVRIGLRVRLAEQFPLDGDEPYPVFVPVEAT
jgi:uncharacterized OB-fold protein